MKRESARRSRRHHVGAAERKLTRRWTRLLPRPPDELMVMLSRADDHSVLRGVVAAGAASVGGPRGKRAARRGLFALAVRRRP
jgi:hypothetical protein